MDVINQPLPSGPSTLCFNKEEFMKNDFNVEHFVVECRRRVSMENLRDDLDVYLRILRSAMIELINKDYADFVNLSTNLVGMDKAINNLITPLSHLKEEMLNVQLAMDEAILAVEKKIKKQVDIRHKKGVLHRLEVIIQSVEKIEKLLGIKHDDELGQGYTSYLSGQLIERVATEFNKLQFNVNKSRGLPLVEEIRPRISHITTTLQHSLEGSLREGMDTGNVEVLRQCLRTYATIDKMRDAENLFRQHVARPYMDEIITEEYIQTNGHGLAGMYDAVLDFIPQNCKKLKEVTSGSTQGGEVVRGYDFLVNAVWPELVCNIEAKTPSIFAPGNPNVFHEKYGTSMEFVDKFERQCGSQASVKRLRSHPSYGNFMSKWGLPIYFQIRFQEIAGTFETALLKPFDTPTEEATFSLHVTETLWQSMHRCWEPDYYLSALCHRFWKLNLQLLARYSTWITEIYVTELSSSQNKQETAMKPGSGDSASTGDVSPAFTMKHVVLLIVDIENLTPKIPDFFNDVVRKHIQQLGLQDTNLLEESLTESTDSLLQQLPNFDTYIINEITNQCSGHLKSTNDIPRLYRKTNREVPSKPSSYVASIFRPIGLFLEENANILKEGKSKKLVFCILENLTEQYLSITSDVLTSVKKMEESLKRLKKSKSSNALSEVKGMSDDDKMRSQLYLDVVDYGKQIESLQVESQSLADYKKLFQLVDSAGISSLSS